MAAQRVPSRRSSPISAVQMMSTLHLSGRAFDQQDTSMSATSDSRVASFIASRTIPRIDGIVFGLIRLEGAGSVVVARRASTKMRHRLCDGSRPREYGDLLLVALGGAAHLREFESLPRTIYHPAFYRISFLCRRLARRWLARHVGGLAANLVPQLFEEISQETLRTVRRARIGYHEKVSVKAPKQGMISPPASVACVSHLLPRPGTAARWGRGRTCAR